jgi:2,4-dienoyl-CoA reductase-like NADH-dependent reductase (Old Yellow Enzyme family)
MNSPLLFQPLTLRQVTLRNRIVVSPMCQYSAQEGMPNDWHLVHLGTRAVGGVGSVIVEATGVAPEARISTHDLGLWNDAQAEAFRKITAFIDSQGAIPGIQLGHAGRKASTAQPWRGGGPVLTSEGGWETIAPSAIPFAEGYPTPRAMSTGDIDRCIHQFEDAAHRAVSAGFRILELHMAHGYLLHQFLSPVTNKRADEYGGGFAGRAKLPIEVARRVRAAWPTTLPLFVRISATDYVDGGWDLDQSIRLAAMLKEIGVDLVDCSSGGLVTYARVPLAPGYQVPFAAAIKRGASVATGAVGLITEPQQAEEILQRGDADVVLLARELLRNPYWPLQAAQQLGASHEWPVQYLRAKTKP